MNLNRTNIILLVLFVVILLTAMLLRVDHSRPNYQIIMGDDMTYSPAFSAYSANENFADGRTIQTPVPGTIARGDMPIYFQATPEDALRAGEELKNPHQAGTEEEQGEAIRVAVDRGGEVFRVSCTPCHGGGGAGDGLVAKRGFPPPPSLLTGKSLQMKDGQLFHILTYGQGSMASFAAQLSPERRWDVIQYVRSLQEQAAKQAAEQTEKEAAEQTEKEAGEEDSTEPMTSSKDESEPNKAAPEPESSTSPPAEEAEPTQPETEARP